MNHQILTALTLCLLTLSSAMMPLAAAEPLMLDYSSLPVTLGYDAKPNILILLDNSGSMNFNAYGSFPGDGKLVVDQPYIGQPDCGTLETGILFGQDDAEEGSVDDGTYNDNDYLNLGSGDGSNETIVGLRLQGIGIPPGVAITKAYIEFTAARDHAGAVSLKIRGEASDAPASYRGTVAAKVPNDISARLETTAAVSWNGTTTPALADWVTDTNHQTPDLSAIVQEIIDRDGWQRDGTMAFTLRPEVVSSNQREAVAFDKDPAAAPRLHIEFTPGACQEYYGYFNPDWFYGWDTNKFVHKYHKLVYDKKYSEIVGKVEVERINCTGTGRWAVQNLAGAYSCLDNSLIVSEKLWDGNWMNWATMRRIDVARKVLMGGLATARTGGDNQTVYGETPKQAGRTFVKHYDSNGKVPVTPYAGNYYYGMSGGYIYVDDDANAFSGELEKLSIAVRKEETYEPNDFHDHNVAGVLQKVGDEVARWGNEFFNEGTGKNESGGTIVHTIGTNMTNLITTIENTGADTWTPLAEAYYVAIQYFKQEDVDTSFDYPSGAAPNANAGDDPYLVDKTPVPCAKSFVILFTDGASTMDSKIPAAYKKDWDSDSDNLGCVEATGTNCDYVSGGTDFLDDLALYARTTDLRADLDDDQNLLLYPIYAFGNDPNARNLLIDAARNGGFHDANGNQQPDLVSEWDSNDDGLPDNYFEATDGKRLEIELLKAIRDILNRASSGTSVSVLATSAAGEGTVVQAYYNPLITAEGTPETATWAGYLQSLWVDQRGFMREDTNQNQRLDIGADPIVQYCFKESTNETMARRFTVSDATPYPDPGDDPCGDGKCMAPGCEEIALTAMAPIWEAGSVLVDTDVADRHIFTNLGATVVDFSPTKLADIKPFLGVKDAATWQYLGNTTHDDRATNLINYIRGQDTDFAGTAKMRNRTMAGKTHKLGDIVNSTPVTVAAPPDKYGLIYSDGSYEAYEKLYTVLKNDAGAIISGRETVIYVGGNDGMLHAFTSWVYDRESREFKQPGSSAVFQTDPPSPVGEKIGTELWAYIPQALLPHLKWLADPTYAHVYYVDLKPKVVDARIFTPDTTHPNGWGTVLIGGMRFGGKEIEVSDDFAHTGADETRSFKSSYFALDVTNPRAPQLLWERSYEDLGQTTFLPSIIKVGDLEYDYLSQTIGAQNDHWFLVLGSGPSSAKGNFNGFNGISTSKGHVYIVDLKTGEPFKNTAGKDWLFETTDADAFLNASASLDKELNYNVDAIYLSEAHAGPGGKPLGAVYKITIPWECTAADCTSVPYGNTKQGEYATDPQKWTMAKFFDAPRPITAPPSLSIDFYDAVWVYFGTGRYFSDSDKTTTDTEYLIGVKDPFFNFEHSSDPDTAFQDNYYHNYAKSLPLDTTASSNLLDAGDYTVVEPGLVYDAADSLFGDFNSFRLEQRKGYNGWLRPLPISGERCLTKPTLFGGLALFTSFLPNRDDVCGAEGSSFLNALYFETGTANSEAVFTNGTTTITLKGESVEKIDERTDLGTGMASSPAIHAGNTPDETATAFVQQSTGQVKDITIDPALKVRSGLRSWQDMTVK